jgi:hypothetical protein
VYCGGCIAHGIYLYEYRHITPRVERISGREYQKAIGEWFDEFAGYCSGTVWYQVIGEVMRIDLVSSSTRTMAHSVYRPSMEGQVASVWCIAYGVYRMV